MKNFFIQLKEKAMNVTNKVFNFIADKAQLFKVDELVIALVCGWFVSLVSPLGFMFQAAMSAILVLGASLYYAPNKEDGKKFPFYLIIVACAIALLFGLIF